MNKPAQIQATSSFTIVNYKLHFYVSDGTVSNTELPPVHVTSTKVWVRHDTHRVTKTCKVYTFINRPLLLSVYVCVCVCVYGGYTNYDTFLVI